MNEIFTDLVDSIFTDMRILRIPSPNLGNVTSDSLRNEIIKRHKNAIAKIEKRRLEIENDTSRIVIAVYDTIDRKSISERDELKKHFSIENFFESKTSWEKYKIDLSKIKESDKFIYKYYSSFPKEQDFFRSKYSFYLGGIVSFSKIQFDSDRNFGVLSGGISYAPLDGYGFLFYIKKDLNGNWIIDKIKGTSIS